MFQHLLVHLDTRDDRTALRQAAAYIARYEGAQIHESTLVRPDVQYGEVFTDDRQSYAQDAKVPESAILQAIKSCQADLVVMGSTCGPEHDHPGRMAVTERVVLTTPIPILLIRSALGLHAREQQLPFHALIVLDGSLQATRILPAATAVIQALAAEGSGDVTLLHVIPPATVGPTEYRRMGMLPRHEAIRLCDEIIARDMRTAIGADVSVSAEVILADDVMATLLTNLRIGHVAGDEPPQLWDLVAIGVSGALHQESMRRSSFIHSILHATTVPMLLQCGRNTAQPYAQKQQFNDIDMQWTGIELGDLIHAAEQLDIPVRELVGSGD